MTGFSILAENRNMIMHSQIVPLTNDKSSLIKTTSRGKTVGCVVTVKQLRKIADDMHAFYKFGIELANFINVPFLAEAFKIGGPIPISCPTKPILPVQLEYSSDPQPF